MQSSATKTIPAVEVEAEHLEQSRNTVRMKGERNPHGSYQMCNM
jgi:hypothetical protein